MVNDCDCICFSCANLIHGECHYPEYRIYEYDKYDNVIKCDKFFKKI